MRKYEEEIILNNFAKERIEENEELFLNEEIELVKNNVSIVKKIYLLGLIDGREIYK